MSIVIGLIVAVGVLGCQAFSTLRGVYAWPFTSYPMYSSNLTAATVAIYRAQLEDRRGHLSWWEPSHRKDKEELSLQFALVLRTCNSQEAFRRGALDVITRFVVHNLDSDYQGPEEDFPVRIRIVLRRILLQAGQPSIRDDTICRIAISRLKREGAN
jgi:hypothetical protein